MCACHARVAPHGASQAGSATADLRHEHNVILWALVILERAAARLAAPGPVDEAALAELVELIDTFGNRCHHGKEEARLFPLLREKGVGGILDAFVGEHEEGRGYLRTLASPAAPAERAAAARRYVGLLRDHIERENDVLFPMADEVLSLDEHDALAQAYEAVEREIVGVGVHERLLATLDRLDAAIPPVEGEVGASP